MSFAPVWMDGLTSEYLKKAEEELGETSESKNQALKDLRRLINEEADFRPQTDDAFLIRFLRARKYDVGKTFTTIRNYYTFKARYSGVLIDIKPTDMLHVLDMNNIFALPKRHPSGAAVGIVRIGYFDIDKVTAEEIFAACMIAMEVIIEPEATQVCGYVLIIDCNKVNLRMVNHYAKPRLLYRSVRVVQDCIPYRIKALHVVNEPFYCSIVFNIVKNFLSEKLSKRIFFHGKNLKSLHQHVPLEILPTEFGGELGSSVKNAKEYCSRVISREPQLEKLKKYGFQEKAVQFIKKQDSRSLFN